MRRILIWAIAGCLVAGFWAAYAAATFPHPSISGNPILSTLINLTCPIAFASRYLHFGVKVYWVLIANAGTYALFGFVVESLRQRLTHAEWDDTALPASDAMGLFRGHPRDSAGTMPKSRRSVLRMIVTVFFTLT